MTAKIFIDGAAGTTGLEIHERLAGRAELSLIQLGDAERKDADARAEALNAADVVILCLPDDAARQAVSLITNNAVKVIDASTAHRVCARLGLWLCRDGAGPARKNRGRQRVANPGVIPQGFWRWCALVLAGIVPRNFALSVNAVSGYSGGGKAMIAEFEDKAEPTFTETVTRTYALNLAHKHVAEMTVHAGLDHAPIFAPSVGRFYRGMMVDVPLPLWALPQKQHRHKFMLF